jgi:(p)ppGpp synthase/HD superfamily hydrolase
VIYTPLTKKATLLAFEAHAGQVGKDGLPCICHALHVAEQMDDEVSTCAALLHDVVEDTDMTLDDLRSQGMPDEVCEAVDLLTHERYQPYIDYVRAIAEDETARKVKLADIAHNMDESRVDPEVLAADMNGVIRRRRKYAEAYYILTKHEEGSQHG